MKLPIAWLKTYLPKLPSPSVLAETLAMHGLEVEEIIDRRSAFDRVVVGHVMAVRPHPNADKLRLADVAIDASGRTQEIVCGAPNLAVGQKVPVALLGAKLPNGLTIESRPIRGIVSNGMLCAEDELGLGQSHAGIMVLDASLKPGTAFATVMGFTDVVLDIAVPANRADLMSVRGLAREIAAILGLKMKALPTPRLTSGKKSTINVAVAASQLCRVYVASRLQGIAVGPSPLWMQNMLRAAGVRPINNIVDVTNYIMLEYGQPLHAFDAAKVQGKITVRPAQSGERLITLDGIARSLDPSTLVIADESGPIALAGVIGGQYTEVTDTTTDIILESAIFHPVSVRRTSRQLGLVSEASKRFEKGLWSSLPIEANQAAGALITKLSGGMMSTPMVVGKSSGQPITVQMQPGYVSERLGMAVAPVKAKKILTQLGFSVSGTTTWKIVVPAWRLDVTGPDDIVDEIGKMVGYEELPESLPLVATVPQRVPNLVKLKDEIRDTLVGFGLIETISHAYYGEDWQTKISGPHFEVQNPLDKSQHYLRRSIVPQVHSILRYEVKAGRDAKIFEVGRVFHPRSGRDITEQQPWVLTVGLAFQPPKGYAPGRKVRGIIEELAWAMKRELQDIEVFVSHDLPGRIIEWCEVPLSRFGSSAGKKYRHFSVYPSVTRDVSFWIAPGAFAAVKKNLTPDTISNLVSIRVTDVFVKGEQTSVTCSYTFQAPDRTLTKDEVDQAMKTVSAALLKLGAVIR